MKILITFKLIAAGVLIYHLCCPAIYSQQRIDVSIIPEYIKKIDSLNNVFENNIQKTNYGIDPIKAQIKKMELNDLKHFAALMYKVSDVNHIALMDSAYNRYLKTQSGENKRPNMISLFGTPIQNEIKEKISQTVYALTRVAYFLCVRVENVKTVIPAEEQMPHAETYVIDAVITEVYKGTGKYNVGDRVQFYYYKSWHKEPHVFEVGKEYFVPLEPRGTSGSQIHNVIALVPYLDDSNGFYPIVDSYLFDKYNYFDYGQKVLYDVFNKRLRDKIKEVKSW